MVTCKTCGYFAIRKNDTREVRCVERDQRNTGRDPNDGKTGGYLYASSPFCFVSAYDLAAEVKDQKEGFVKCANAERDCDKTQAWISWIEGLTPLQHWIMNELGEIQQRTIEPQLQMQAAFRDAMSEHLRWQRDFEEWKRQCQIEDRDYRDQKDAAEKAYRDSKDLQARKWRCQDLCLYAVEIFLVGIVATLVLAGAQVLST
jgi:hypothetical protein